MSNSISTLDVSTVNLSADLSATDSQYGTADLDAIPVEQLRQLLENFSGLNEVDNHTHEPRVRVKSPFGEFTVRMSTGKLYLYDTHDMTQPPAELDVAGLIAVFTGSEAPEDDVDELDQELPPAASKWKAVMGAGLLVVGLGLNVWAIRSYLQPDPVWPPPVETTVVTDPGTLAQYEALLPGSYATGTGAGQRAIVISPDQSITFQLLGSGDAGTVIRESHDTYALGRYDQTIQLVTQRFGVVEVRADGELSFSGDLYMRETADG